MKKKRKKVEKSNIGVVYMYRVSGRDRRKVTVVVTTTAHTTSPTRINIYSIIPSDPLAMFSEPFSLQPTNVTHR